MDNLNDIININNNIKLLYELNNNNLLINSFNTLIENEYKYKDKLNELENIIKQQKLTINNLNNIINDKQFEIKQYKEDIESYSKVSYIISMNKEITTQKNYIKILESQISKYKSNHIKNINENENIDENIDVNEIINWCYTYLASKKTNNE
jgi:uncharacterized coiled-coil protein SlyX